jgi:hypothetical protein
MHMHLLDSGLTSGLQNAHQMADGSWAVFCRGQQLQLQCLPFEMLNDMDAPLQRLFPVTLDTSLLACVPGA